MAKTKGYPEALEKKLHDQRYSREDSNPEFTKNVKAISRTIAHMCYQCGTCTGSCPSAPRSTYRIRKFMRRAVLGLENEALTDPDLWLCTTCYSCSDRCPRDIAPNRCHHGHEEPRFQAGYRPGQLLKDRSGDLQLRPRCAQQ